MGHSNFAFIFDAVLTELMFTPFFLYLHTFIICGGLLTIIPYFLGSKMSRVATSKGVAEP